MSSRRNTLSCANVNKCLAKEIKPALFAEINISLSNDVLISKPYSQLNSIPFSELYGIISISVFKILILQINMHIINNLHFSRFCWIWCHGFEIHMWSTTMFSQNVIISHSNNLCTISRNKTTIPASLYPFPRKSSAASKASFVLSLLQFFNPTFVASEVLSLTAFLTALLSVKLSPTASLIALLSVAPSIS